MSDPDKHLMLKKKFLSMLAESVGSPTEEEISMLDLFLATDDHMTLDDFVTVVEGNYSDMDRRTVKRFMDMLVDYGIARHSIIDGKDHYEHFHLYEHHDHLVCMKCGHIDVFHDASIELQQVKSAREKNFTPLMHRLEILGICSKCRNSMPKVFRLNKAFEGDTVVLRGIHGGRKARHELLSMGLTPGTPLKVSHTHGKLLLIVRGSKIALGRGMAAKIEVERVDSANVTG